MRSVANEIRIDGAGKKYPTKSGAVSAIAGISLTISEGSFVSIVGRSGCGKSTLLRMICGLTQPTEGAVTLGGEAVYEPPDSMRYVFQDYAQSLFPWKTVAQNVRFGAKHSCRGANAAPSSHAAIVAQVLDLVDLTAAADRYPWELSGGMQQRVAIGRALAAEPSVLLMDEPFSAIDALSRANLQDIVLRLWGELRLSVVFVTHDIDEAVFMSDRVLVVNASGAGIDADVEIDLPRPRKQVETRELGAYLEYRRQLLRRVLD